MLLYLFLWWLSCHTMLSSPRFPLRMLYCLHMPVRVRVVYSLKRYIRLQPMCCTGTGSNTPSPAPARATSRCKYIIMTVKVCAESNIYEAERWIVHTVYVYINWFRPLALWHSRPRSCTSRCSRTARCSCLVTTGGLVADRGHTAVCPLSRRAYWG